MAFARYALRRGGEGVFLVLSVIVIVFLLIHLAPGDPLTAMVGEYPHTEAYTQEMRAKFGLDKPLYEQLGLYLVSVAKLDLGYSFHYQAPVAVVISERMGATLMLMVGAIVLAAIVGLILGLLSSLRPYSVFDNMGTIVSLAGYSLPVFWLGQVLMLLLAVKLGWLPAQGIRSVRESYTGWAQVVDVLKHLAMPLFVLSLRYIGINARMTRASMLEVLRQDYIITARAKGVSEASVVLKHAFRNALLPVVTIIGVNLGFVLTGSVLVETVFAWPGIGLLTYEAVNTRDYPILLGVFIMVSIVVFAANFLTDIAYALLDPRIRY